MKKYIVVFLYTLIFIPSIVSAVWWNPSTWFKKPTPPAPVVEVRQPIVPANVIMEQITSHVEKKVEDKKPVLNKKEVKKIVPKKTADQIYVEQQLQQAIENSKKAEQMDALLKAYYSQIDSDYNAQHKAYQDQYNAIMKESLQQKNERENYFSQLDQIRQQIRSEVQAAGGFATDSQVEALATQRLKEKGINLPVVVPSPSAICNDGTSSYSQNRSGTCSYHGGVVSWY